MVPVGSGRFDPSMDFNPSGSIKVCYVREAALETVVRK
jgi:hypothetical protein